MILPRGLRAFPIWLLAVTCCLVAPSAATTAQAATLRGIVTDPDGRVVPRARVLVVSATAIVATAETDGAGRYHLADLPAGTFDLEVVAPGFRSLPARVRLDPDEVRDQPLSLQISAVTESVVVSAARVERPQSRVPDSVTVLTAADLAGLQIDTLADALRRVPGLTVTQSGGRGGITALFPRGGESDFTLVLVDGVPVNSFGGGFDLARLSLAGVERIEVVRGPQSALYGSGAIGAVVHVLTQQGDAPGVSGLLEYGSLATARLAAGARGARAAWRWGLAAERVRTDGFTGLAPASGDPVTNDDHDATHVVATAGWDGPRGLTLRGHVRVEDSARGFPGPYGSDPAGLFGGIDTVSRGDNRAASYAIDAAVPSIGPARFRAQVSYLDLDGRFVSPYGVSESGTARLSARGQVDIAPGDTAGWSAGAELVRERAHSTFITAASADPVPVRRQVAALFGEWRADVASRVYLAAGVRVERITREALAGDDNPFSPRPPFAADARTAVTPKLAVAWYLQPPAARARGWTRFHASAGTGIRPPDAFEIAFTDNPSLAPERSRSMDAGIERAFAAGRLVVDVTIFANHYDDLIVAVGRSQRDASRYRTDNISNARAVGAELAATLRPIPGLEARVSYTFLDTAILAVDGASGEAPPPFEPGDPLIRRPRHQASADLLWQLGRVTSFVRTGGRGGMLDVEPNLGTFGGLFDVTGYVAVDAGASVRLSGSAELLARVSNLFDRRYEETLGFPAPRRAGFVGVRLAAGR